MSELKGVKGWGAVAHLFGESKKSEEAPVVMSDFGVHDTVMTVTVGESKESEEAPVVIGVDLASGEDFAVETKRVGGEIISCRVIEKGEG